MDENGPTKWETISEPGKTGLHTLIDPQDIADTDIADCKNVLYNGGFVIPRQGYIQTFPKPAGETGTPLNAMTAKTSIDANNYLIAVYGINFYLWDPTNAQTILINGAVTSLTIPTNPSSWSYINWSGGFGKDVVYIGNGVDNTIKWQIALTTNSVAIAAIDTTITLTDGSQFPASGTAIVQAVGGSPISAAWTSKTGTNVLNLGGAFGSAIIAGSSVTVSLVQVSSIPAGRIMVTHQRRLFSINQFKAESVINYSVVNTPEDFSTTTGVNGAGAETLADNEGPITAAYDSQDFLIIGKKNTWAKFQFNYDTTLASKIIILQEIMTGKSLGPISQESVIKNMSNYVYITETDGFLELQNSGSTAGTSAALTLNLLSKNINDRTGAGGVYFYQNITSQYFDQRGYWAVATTSSMSNSLVLVYDFIFDAWFVFDNWNVADFTELSSNLYFLDNSSGAMNQCYQSYQDGGSTYIPYFMTKRFDFGESSIPKTADKVFVQGYMDRGTSLLVDVIFNENTVPLAKQTYQIDVNTRSGTGDPILLTPSGGGMGDFPFGTAMIGGRTTNVTPAQALANLGVFRCYLDISSAKGFYNIQLKFYSQVLGSKWAVDKISFNPELENTFPVSLVINPL